VSCHRILCGECHVSRSSKPKAVFRGGFPSLERPILQVASTRSCDAEAALDHLEVPLSEPSDAAAMVDPPFVRQFRQILLWPLQVMSADPDAPAPSRYWEPFDPTRAEPCSGIWARSTQSGRRGEPLERVKADICCCG
jgi:hypothetical protein